MLTAITKGLAAKRDRLEKDDKGFTLIELLVVILIIGILAAIAIPVFLGQQNSAKDSAAKSDLANAKIAMIAYATANGGTYLGPSDSAATYSALKDFGAVKSSTTPANNVAVITSAGGVFCLQAKSDAGGEFKITDSAGAVSGACGS